VSVLTHLVPLATGGVCVAVGGALARTGLELWHQRRQARMWRVVRLQLPADYRPDSEALKGLATALWGKLGRSPFLALLYGQPRAAIEVRADSDGTYWHLVVPADETKFLGQLIGTYLPGAGYEEVDDYLRAPIPKGRAMAATEIRLARHAAYPIAEFTPTFPSALLGVLDGCRDQGEITVQVLLRPARDREWKREARVELLKAEGKLPEGASGNTVFDAVNGAVIGMFDAVGGAPGRQEAAPTRVQTSRLERAATRDTPAKLLAPGFDAQIRVMAVARNRREAASLAARTAALFAQLNGNNNLIDRPLRWFPSPKGVWQNWARRYGPSRVHAGAAILTPEELTSLICPATRQADTDQLRVIELRQPPLPDGIHICDGQYRGKRVAVRVKPSDLDKHLGVFGETGSGKGVIQEHLFRECAKAGMGGLYLDPLGGSVRKLLASLPEERMGDVIYIEAGHPRWATPLNLLAVTDGDPENTVAGAVNAYYRLWESAWGKSTEEYLRAATTAVIDAGGTLAEVDLVLSSPEYRKSILPRVQNGSIRNHLAGLPDKVNETMRAPLNKLHELVWSPSILAMVGQADTLDWRRIIQERRLVLVNANKGLPKIGELGAALVSTIIWSAMIRASLSIPVPERRRFILIADELRDVASRAASDFETALIQLRQYLKPVVGAGQYPDQLPEKVYSAMGGMGSKLVLRQEAEHAQPSLRYLSAVKTLEAGDLANLPSLVGYANLLVDERKTGLFTCWAPPFSQQIRDPDEAAERSLQQWARPRDKVLTEIAARYEQGASDGRPPVLD
jgi:hypothetical protein